MPWRKLLPRPRWLPRAVLMHPARLVVWCFVVVILMMLVVGARDLFLLRERVLTSRQHDLTLRALGVEAVLAAERYKLTFVRDYAQQQITIQESAAARPPDAAIEAAYAARNQPVWQLAVPNEDSSIIGVSPQLLSGLEGFERRDADLRADLYAARQLSHVLGLNQRNDATAGAVTFISSNGFYITFPPLAADKAPALLRRLNGMPYYRDLLPDRNPNHELRWSSVYTQFESTQQRTTVSVPIYVDNRFRGVVAVDLSLRQLRTLLGTPDDADAMRYMLDRKGKLMAASTNETIRDLRWPDALGERWKHLTLAELFSARSGVRQSGGEYLLFQTGDDGNWMLLDTLKSDDLNRAVLARMSQPLLVIWFLLPLLMLVTIRVVTLLFDHYMALGEKLQQLAEHDPLTNLANRRHFSDLFRRESARRHREGHPLATLMLDIDYFKRVNDRWGHASGDRVLQRLATAVKENLRAEDTPARLGGEEFAVLLPGATLAEATATAERLRAAIAAIAVEPAPDAPPQEGGDGRIHFTISIGVAEAGIDGSTTLDAMLATADRRLYAAKAAGRNRVCASDAPAGSVAAPTVQG